MTMITNSSSVPLISHVGIAIDVGVAMNQLFAYSIEYISNSKSILLTSNFSIKH
jgi:hypothetical protein